MYVLSSPNEPYSFSTCVMMIGPPCVIGSGEKSRIGTADLHVRRRQQPCRKTAKIPFRADVRTGTENHPESLLLRSADVFRKIEIATEVELARPRLMQVPEDVCGKRVQAHRLHQPHALAPVRTRHPCIVHLAGDDLERLSIKEKMLSAPAEGVRRLL